MTTQEPVNILCLKWGTRYGPIYVNNLYAGVRRHLHRPFRFVCVTDNPEGLVEGIETVPFPANPGMNRQWPNIFVKLLIFQDGFANLKGPTLFMDIDLLITGDLDCFFDFHPGERCIIHNWIERYKRWFRKVPPIGNSSCFRFEAGKSNDVYETFLREKDDPALAWKFTKGSQKFQTYAMKQVVWWPEEWVCSFKRHCMWSWPLNKFLTPRLPKGCRILAFHGRPDLDVALTGYHGLDRGRKVNTHHTCLPTPWIRDYWPCEPEKDTER